MSDFYQVLARKYRPRILSELVGHDVLVATLQNAIELNRIHHAFLLTGTRVVGKTTTARIIALSLNCTGKDGLNAKPVVEACLECSNCKQIINGTHPDVIEFDAASKTGIDSMREIIDSCVYPPMQARFKVYIIDEVHMLSKAAFNALLKTLEEPPSFVKFIFATTEIRKVPVTVLSRCQKFVLRNLSAENISSNLTMICKKENFIFDDLAIKLIAKAAAGSARDSLSLLDQAMANCPDKNISFQHVKNMLAMPDEQEIIDFLDAILCGDLKLSFELVERIASHLHDIQYILSTLLEKISFLMRACSTNSSDELYDLAVIFNKYKGQINAAFLNRIWQIIIASMEEAKFVETKTLLQMLCMKLIYAATLPTPNEIIKELSKNILT